MCGVVPTLCSFVFSTRTRIFYSIKSTCYRNSKHILYQDIISKASTCSTPSTVPYISRLYASQSVNNDKKGSNPNDTNKQKKSKEIKKYITLLGVDKNMYVTTVEDATKIADRRNYKLVKVKDLDTKSGRAVYQLMTEAEFLKFDDDDVKVNKSSSVSHAKSEKSVSINSAISENDLKTKVKMMKKWLSKMLKVNVVVTGDSSLSEKVYSFIEKEIGTDGKVVKTKSKGGIVRFVVNPLNKATEEKT